MLTTPNRSKTTSGPPTANQGRSGQVYHKSSTCPGAFNEIAYAWAGFP